MRTIEIFLFDDALSLDITGPLEVFNSASMLLEREGRGDRAYRFEFTAAETGMIPLCSGLKLLAETEIGKCGPPDTLLIPGGKGVDKVTKTPSVLERIRYEAERAGRVVSVCNGAFILAACGLLDGKRATTHWLMADELVRRYPDTQVLSDAIYIQDGNIATSAGVTAGIDLALALVEDDHGPELAMDVARLLVLYLRRAGGQSQFSAPLDSQELAGKRFRELYDWIIENLCGDLSVTSLAERSGMSPRNFSRVFTSQIGMSPGRYVETIRLSHAREMLECGVDPLDKIADACGFGHEERLRRVFIRRLGITPGRYRNHFRNDKGQGG